jgi:hypothetical protein
MDYTPSMARRCLRSVSKVIEALDGIGAVAALTRSKPKAVSAWKTDYDVFPAKTYVVIMAALAARDLTAVPSLWRMILPVPQRRQKPEALPSPCQAARRKTDLPPFRGVDAAQR